MAEESDAADKSFEASARKLSDLRKKGEIVRSTDLLIGISYLGLCSCLYLFGDFIFEMTWANLYRSWGMLCVDVMPSCRPRIDDSQRWGHSPIYRLFSHLWQYRLFLFF